jgi:DNA-binding response OmpR family regulator
MRAILRRGAGSRRTSEHEPLCVEGLKLDSAARMVLQNGREIELTDIEFALLEALMRSPGEVVPREELSDRVLGRKFDPFDRSLDMHVSRLRRKLVAHGSHGEQVKTIRGVGYQLTVGRSPVESTG